MPTAAAIDVADFIDRRRFSRYQLVVSLLCMVVLLCDNMDLQAVAFSGPSILHDLHLRPRELGLVFSAGLFGMMLGSIIFGPLADRFGRRGVMITSVALFAVFTLATAWANTADAIIVLRFLAGLGFGGAMPNAFSMIAEYLPRRLRLTLLGLFSSSFTFGGVISGFIAAPVVTHFGWRAIYMVDGAIAIIAAFIVFLWLPESLHFLADRRGGDSRIRKILARIDPGATLPPDARFTTGERAGPASPVVQLFTEGRLWLTIPLWIMSFCFLVDIYFVINWTPVLARQNGIPLFQSVLAPAFFSAGATIAALIIGPVMNFFGPFIALIGISLLAAVSVAASAFTGTSGTFLLAVNTVCGLFVVCGMGAVNVAATTMYPTASRTTGIGWSLGVGRLGSFVGPLVGGVLLAMQWAASSLFLLAALPPLLAAAAAVVLAVTGARFAALIRRPPAAAPELRETGMANAIKADHGAGRH